MDTLKIKKPVLPPNTLSFKEWRKKHNISTNYKEPKWYSQFKARVELGEDFLVIKKNQINPYITIPLDLWIDLIQTK